MSDLNSNIITEGVQSLFEAAAASGLAWDHANHKTAKEELKQLLLDAQHSKCAYCRRQIRDEIGHVEIDHVLPKAPRGSNTFWQRNERQYRRRTAGYPGFTFNAKNLVLTCKHCNHSKGSYDGRRDRSLAPAADYVLDVDYYDWMHPYIHKSADHLFLEKELIYQAVTGSTIGETLIMVCRLARIDAIERTSRERMLRLAEDLSDAILSFLPLAKTIGWDEISNQLHSRFHTYNLVDIKAVVAQFQLAISMATSVGKR